LSLWLLMAALVAAVALVVTRPWWRGGWAAAVERRRANVAAYRTRLAELEDETAAGLVSSDEAKALRRELDARLVVDVAQEDTVAAAPGTTVHRARGWLPALLITLLLALFAGGWYGLGGSWRAQQQAETVAAGEHELAGMVQKLADRLQRQPDDAQGWAMLGRSYAVMQRYADAARAYGEANARSPEPDAEWLTGEGEALALSRDRDLLGRPQQLFERALQLEPDYAKALWYAGLAAQEAGDSARAGELWMRLSHSPELPAQMREVVQARLAELGGSGSPAAAAAAPAAPAAAGAVELRLHIAVAPGLAAQLPENASLFVFAKADGGPPMPLAVQRLPGARLPADVRLDDSMGMTPAMRLSQFERYVVTARLSRSGGAQAQSGDLEGSLKLTRDQAGQPLELIIDHAVP
jgi:cytochrome c-type biogenesis protein CcmH